MTRAIGIASQNFGTLGDLINVAFEIIENAKGTVIDMHYMANGSQSTNYSAIITYFADEPLDFSSLNNI